MGDIAISKGVYYEDFALKEAGVWNNIAYYKPMTYAFKFQNLINEDESQYNTYHEENKMKALATEQTYAFIRILKATPQWDLYDADKPNTIYI